MTFLEIIELTDEREPNQFDTAQKLRWLNELQERMDRETQFIMEGETTIPQSPAATAPFTQGSHGGAFETEICIQYLIAQIAAANGETERYNRAVTLFNDRYAAWLSQLIRRRHGVKRIFSI